MHQHERNNYAYFVFKCHISIYILEKGVVKFEPLGRQEVYDTML